MLMFFSGKEIKCRLAMLFLKSFLRNEFYKFNNTGARFLDPIYHMTFRLLSNIIFSSHCIRNVVTDVHFMHVTLPNNI